MVRPRKRRVNGGREYPRRRIDKLAPLLVGTIFATAIQVAGPAEVGAAHLRKHHESRAARHYLAIVKPVNQAVSTFKSTVSAAGTTATGATLATDATPLVSALTTADTKLTTYHWPKRTRADVRSLVRADAALIGALGSASTVNALNAGSWVQQVAVAASTASADSGIVRHDLGLRQR